MFLFVKISVNRKENELHRKYKVFGGSTENAKAPPILEIEQNLWFHWILHDSECRKLSLKFIYIPKYIYIFFEDGIICFVEKNGTL